MNSSKKETRRYLKWVRPTDQDKIDEWALAASFTLSASDKELVLTSHGAHNRLGLALQVCWLRHLGWQLNSFDKTPKQVTEFVAGQLNLQAAALVPYHRLDRTQFREHARRARRHLGWVKCGTKSRQALKAHLHDIALQHSQTAGLRKAGITWLAQKKVCRPSARQFARLVSGVRKEATDEVITRISRKLSPSLRLELDKFVATPKPGYPSELQVFLAPPPVASSKRLKTLLDRISRLREIGIEDLDWSNINANRARGLANMARRLRPRDLRTDRSASDRGYAIIACGLSDALMRMNDDAIEMHDQLMLRLRSRANEARDAALLSKRDIILRLIGLLHTILVILLHPKRLLKAIGGAIFRIFRKGFLRTMLAECKTILEPARENGLTYLRAQWPRLRRFGPRFLATMKFEHTAAGAGTFSAIEFLREVDDGQRIFVDPPTGWMPRKMRKTFARSGAPIDRGSWEILLHERIAHDLRAGDLWVRHSREYLPLAFDLNVPEAEKSRFLKAFPHMVSADAFLTFLREGYVKVMAEAEKVLPKPAADDTEPKLPIVDMTTDEDAPDTKHLRSQLFGQFPRRQLPQVLRQVLAWVDFLEPLRDAMEDDLRIPDLVDRLLFIMVGEGCNIGLDNMATATDRYSYNQLAHIASRCLQPELLKRAIASVINQHQKMWLTPLWGKGIWSSADGQLFTVSHKMLRSRRHPKAPPRLRVVNLVTHVLDTLVSYASVLIQTTSHENRVHLDGLLYHEADVHPRKHTSDTAGYTDIMFGMTSMLRIFFAPRIRSPRESRLYFWDKADAQQFPNVCAYLDEQVRLGEVKANWDSIVNLLAAAWCGITPPSRSMRKLEALGERSALYRSIQAIGRVEKTIVFLSYAISPTLQADVIKQNTKTEHSNQLQDQLFFGNKGIIRQNDPLDIYTRLLCLRLLVNAVILYNTAWLQAAVKSYRGIGVAIPDDLLAHVWPTATAHINLLGYFIVDDAPDLQVGIEELKINLQQEP